MTTVQQIKELYKVIKYNGQATTAKCIVGANANIYTNLGINLSGTTAVPRPYSVMIGQDSLAQGDHSIAIGRGAYAKSGCVAIGQYTTATQSDDFKVVIGDGDVNTRHNCFTSDGSSIIIDNKQINIGINSSVVNIGNKEEMGINIGNGVNSWIYLGFPASSHVMIGEGNNSTVHVGDSTSSDVSIGEGVNSTVRIGNSFEGRNIWNASKVFLNSPVSDVYIPIEFDFYTVTVDKSSTGGTRVAIPLKINTSSYTLYNIPKGTRYAITVTSSVSWGASQNTRISALSLGEDPQVPSTPVSYEMGSDQNDTNNSRSVFVATYNMVKAHNNLGLYIYHPDSTDTEYTHTIMITMYVPLKGLALDFMQKNFS